MGLAGAPEIAAEGGAELAAARDPATGAEAGGVKIWDLMEPGTRAYFRDEGKDWMIKDMGFGNYLDENLLVCIQALVSSGESRGNSKVSVFIGQAYFILLSLFFTNSTLIFVDPNKHLLNAMKTMIDNFQTMVSFDVLFTRMESENLREKRNCQEDLRKVTKILSLDDEETLFQRCKQNFSNNTYVLCEASITDDPLFGYLCDYSLDYFSMTNLHYYGIPLFWETIYRLHNKNPGLYFIASDGLAKNQYIFKYDRVFTTDSSKIFHFSLNDHDWIEKASRFYAQHDFVKYVYVVKNQVPKELKNTL